MSSAQPFGQLSVIRITTNGNVRNEEKLQDQAAGQNSIRMETATADSCCNSTGKIYQFLAIVTVV